MTKKYDVSELQWYIRTSYGSCICSIATTKDNRFVAK